MKIDSCSFRQKKTPLLESYYQEVLTLPHVTSLKEDHSRSYEAAVEFFKNLDTVVLLGTGGSSLGAQTIYHAFKNNSRKKFIFLDNIDPFTLTQVSKEIDLLKTGFLVISKSGNTPETLSQFLFFKEFYAAENLKKHFFIITEEKQSALTTFCDLYSLQTVDHPTDIGGRYSVFSVVGMIPAALMGLNPSQFKAGAISICEDVTDNPSLIYSDWHYNHYLEGKTLTVVMPYCDRLKLLPVWFRQLWAESLGKEGKGLTPIDANGTVDQHSQVQLYLDGPKDKTFTLLWVEEMNQTKAFETSASHPSLNILKTKTLNDLYRAEYQALYDTVDSKNLPIRKIEISKLDEFNLGKLMMLFVLETILVAKLMNVDPFDQPAVELGKKRTFELL